MKTYSSTSPSSISPTLNPRTFVNMSFILFFQSCHSSSFINAVKRSPLGSTEAQTCFSSSLNPYQYRTEYLDSSLDVPCFFNVASYTVPHTSSSFFLHQNGPAVAVHSAQQMIAPGPTLVARDRTQKKASNVECLFKLEDSRIVGQIHAKS